MESYLAGCTACGTVNLVEPRPGQPPAVSPIRDPEASNVPRFVADRCLVAGGTVLRIQTGELIAAYEQWCESHAEAPVTRQVMGRILLRLWPISAYRSSGKRYYTGVALKLT